MTILMLEIRITSGNFFIIILSGHPVTNTAMCIIIPRVSDTCAAGVSNARAANWTLPNQRKLRQADVSVTVGVEYRTIVSARMQMYGWSTPGVRRGS